MRELTLHTYVLMVERTLLRLGKPSFIIVDPEWDTIVSVSAATRLAYDMYFVYI